MLTGEDDEDEEDDGLTEALTDLQQQLNSDLSRVEAAVVAEERDERIEVRLSGTAEPSREAGAEQGGQGSASAAMVRGCAARRHWGWHAEMQRGVSLPVCCLLLFVHLVNKRCVCCIWYEYLQMDTACVQARRTTYPAGRILHMVPAYLLLGEDALFEEYQGGGALRASMRDVLSDEEDTEGRLEEARSLSKGGLRPEAAGKVRALCWLCCCTCGDGGLPLVLLLLCSHSCRQALQGRRVRYMLMDNVPHECYGRIKLCRTMIQVGAF